MEKLTGPSCNVQDPLDIVLCPCPNISSDYLANGTVKAADIAKHNDGMWHHAMIRYLAGNTARNVVRDAFEMAKETIQDDRTANSL